MQKKGSAHWSGDLESGKGQISTESGALNDQPYGFNTRFEGKPGSNPEELVGAAHAACFSMAMSLQLGEAGFLADDISTEATVTLDKVDDGFAVTKVHLDVTAQIAGIENSKFQDIAEATKKGCPISKLLNAEITMEARLG